MNESSELNRYDEYNSSVCFYLDECDLNGFYREVNIDEEIEKRWAEEDIASSQIDFDSTKTSERDNNNDTDSESSVESVLDSIKRDRQLDEDMELVKEKREAALRVDRELEEQIIRNQNKMFQIEASKRLSNDKDQEKNLIVEFEKERVDERLWLKERLRMKLLEKTRDVYNVRKDQIKELGKQMASRTKSIATRPFNVSYHSEQD